MIKLYKTIQGAVHYCEAWEQGGEVILHRGLVGDQGETSIKRIPASRSPAQAIEDALSAARAEGFSEFSGQRQLVLQCPASAGGTDADVEKRHEIELLLNESLGWTGNGRCTGGDVVSTTINLYAEVVDTEAALQSLVPQLEADLSQCVIALVVDSGYEVLWPKGHSGEFALPSADEVLEAGSFEHENCHPATRQLLADSFFWSLSSDYSPHGSDDGADVFADFLSADAATKNDPVGFLHRTFIGFGFPWPVSTTTVEEELRGLLAQDRYAIPCYDNCVIALAFAQLKVLGACDEELRGWALSAVERQSMPFMIEWRGWVSAAERIQTLQVTAEALAAAPTSSRPKPSVTRLEFKDGKSAKFWEVEITGSSFIRRWGRIGTPGREQRETFKSASATLSAAQSLIDSKLRKGYVRRNRG